MFTCCYCAVFVFLCLWNRLPLLIALTVHLCFLGGETNDLIVEKWMSFSSVWCRYSCSSKGVFTPVPFNLFKSNSGLFSPLVQFICADAWTRGNGLLVWKYPKGELSLIAGSIPGLFHILKWRRMTLNPKLLLLCRAISATIVMRTYTVYKIWA